MHTHIHVPLPVPALTCIPSRAQPEFPAWWPQAPDVPGHVLAQLGERLGENLDVSGLADEGVADHLRDSLASEWDTRISRNFRRHEQDGTDSSGCWGRASDRH